MIGMNAFYGLNSIIVCIFWELCKWFFYNFKYCLCIYRNYFLL